MLEFEIRKTLSVLIVEDNVPDVYILQSQLERNPHKTYSFTHCQTKKETLSVLREHTKFDIAFLDLGIPDSIDFELLDYLVAYYQDLPVIILTGYGDTQRATQAIQRGAQDYLMKNNINAESTIKAIDFAISRKISSVALLEKEQMIRNLMFNFRGMAYECVVNNGIDILKLEYGNGNLRRQLGISKDQFPDLKKLIPHKEQKRLLKNITEQCKEGQVDTIVPVNSEEGKLFLLMQGKSTKLKSLSNGYLLKGIIIDITERQLREKELKRQRNRAFQLHSQLKSAQLNPHFLFNALASIQHFIVQEDSRNALDLTSDFALLVREVLNNSTNTYISLEKEIQFLKRYISLESKRLQQDFELKFNYSDDLEIESLNIPPMLIQPLVENALIHGLSGLTEKGVLSINFSLVKDMIECTIEDNGLGKVATGEKEQNRRYGASQILDERLDTLRQLSNKSFSLTVEDMSDRVNRGTRVILKVPADLY